ncbi:MAG: hypothetical protein EKK41_01350 [Hyphomicrobiales bacterium]|nr:MAG: hypothetical protein EKK41_01350 [Hyphomicrobiales bacterium]
MKVQMGSMLRHTLALAVMLTAQQARAQDIAPAKCPLLNDTLLKRVAAFVKGKGQCETSCRGCGCKGGPGYRQKTATGKGKCVSWAEVISVCGPAPHRGCVAECSAVVPKCIDRALGIAWLIKFAAENGDKVETQPPDNEDEKSAPTN